MSEQEPQNDRLSRIASNNTRTQTVNVGYSKFIRTMKMALPLVAVILTVIVFVWSTNEEELVPAQTDAKATRTIGKNELLSPHFNSIDNKDQPYTIKAKRAIQGEANENLIILEEPIGDILLENGTWIAIEADQGAYRQDNQRLLLKGNVNLYHDQGYQLTTEQLHIDMENNTLWSKQPVSGHGPAGTIEATGMRGDNNTGVINFEGRAKLTIHDTDAAGNALGGLGE